MQFKDGMVPKQLRSGFSVKMAVLKALKAQGKNKKERRYIFDGTYLRMYITR